MSEFVDTSVFIRFLSGDDADKMSRSREMFRQAERGTRDLVTSESIVLEVVHVLSSPRLYRMPRHDIAVMMRSLLRNQGLKLEHKTSIIRAFDRYETTRLDFADCLSIEHVRRQGLSGIFSYDRDFDRVPGIRWLEP